MLYEMISNTLAHDKTIEAIEIHLLKTVYLLEVAYSMW